MANKTYVANSISVLEGLEAVRKRPGMYIGSVSTKGLNHLIYEIVDNSVDEFLAGYCDEITVSLNKDGTATITDYGRGIPVGINERTGKTVNKICLCNDLISIYEMRNAIHIHAEIKKDIEYHLYMSKLAYKRMRLFIDQVKEKQKNDNKI